jgi:hypothetical protein
MQPSYGAPLWLSPERRRDNMFPCCGDTIAVSVGKIRRHCLTLCSQGPP